MKGNECDIVEWRFIEWNGINRRKGVKNNEKWVKNIAR